jgi:hypothetical protein
MQLVAMSVDKMDSTSAVEMVPKMAIEKAEKSGR